MMDRSRLMVAVAGVVLALLVGGCGGEGDEGVAPVPSPSRSVPAATAPATTAPAPMTAKELLWLHAVEKLLPKMNKAFTDSPSELTPSALKSLANEVRGCSRELARIGTPGTRLQPVYVRVTQACQEYDKGATCFADGARIGVPSSSDAVRQLEKEIKCGFAASEKGGSPLAEAQVKAAEIKAEL